MDDHQRAALKSRLADVHASFEQAEQSIVCDTLAGWNSLRWIHPEWPRCRRPPPCTRHRRKSTVPAELTQPLRRGDRQSTTRQQPGAGVLTSTAVWAVAHPVSPIPSHTDQHDTPRAARVRAAQRAHTAGTR